MSCVTAKHPTLFPLTLRSTEPADPVVIGCLAQDFVPSKHTNVTWDSSGPGTSISTVLPMFTSRGLYTMVSQLTLPASQCPASRTLKCHVQYNSSLSQTKDVPCKGQRLGQGGVGAIRFLWWNHHTH